MLRSIVLPATGSAYDRATGDLWRHYYEGYICITTNGCVKSNGECVMGRGVAFQATQRFPGIAREIGGLIRKGGNHVHVLDRWKLCTLPVKHHWKEEADTALIKDSISELETVADMLQCNFYLPRPGCGNGRLQWSDVRPFLTHLSDRFIVVNK